MDQDIAVDCSVQEFASTLRRIADALESTEGIRIQVVDERLIIPRHAQLSIEHEAVEGGHALELQLRWQED